MGFVIPTLPATSFSAQLTSETLHSRFRSLLLEKLNLLYRSSDLRGGGCGGEIQGGQGCWGLAAKLPVMDSGLLRVTSCPCTGAESPVWHGVQKTPTLQVQESSAGMEPPFSLAAFPSTNTLPHFRGG